MNTKLLAWFSEIGKEDTNLVGGKGANLGEMTSIGMPIPPGFVVTANAYKLFLEENRLIPRMREILAHLDVNDPVTLSEVSRHIQRLIKTSPVPEQISRELIDSYNDLNHKISKSNSGIFKRLASNLRGGNIPVAVRSSATTEDSKAASFAGQNATFLNIIGESNVVEAVRECWASLFEARSIFYRVQNHFDHFESFIAVVVQTMIQSEVSGIMFSLDPVTNNRNRVVIESIWGLGEYIVGGKLSPDHYEVNKSDLVITEKMQTDQKIQLVRKPTGETIETKVPKGKQQKFKMTDDQIRDLARLSLALEKHYYFPQDSEFAIQNDKIYLVQTRPITTVHTSSDEDQKLIKKEEEVLHKLDPILEGAPASPGIKSGPVKILKSASEIGKIVPGDVLVASQTNPDYVPAMKKAVAIVTDNGGRTSHAAIVSRELGIPCVVGTGEATSVLKNGEVITVNGSDGKVYRGMPKIEKKDIETTKPVEKTSEKQEETPLLKTATKVYVNLAEPEKAKEIAALNCDGVGLLRAEFMLAGIGVHPKKAIEDGKQKEFTQQLADKMAMFAQAFYPRPVVYRATDFKTNEYRTLKGGEKFEPHEENPMIGFRGAYRYIVQPEVFKMEIEAIMKVRNKEGFKNLWLMIPFCRTVKELQEVKSLVASWGLHRSPSFQLWMMCEIPANVILLEDFLDVGIDGISVGSNDLTMLTLGVDRDNASVASEYDERNEAVMQSFEKIIKTCHKKGVTCSMCGQAPSDYPELTERLVELGITSVSVNPDVVNKTRQIISEAEKKVLTKKN